MSAFKKSYIPLIGALLVVVGFFLPWVAAEILDLLDLGLDFSPSAFGLANLGRSSEMVDFVPEGRILLAFWLFLIIGLAVIGLAIWAMRNPHKERTAALWQMIAGAVGLALIIGPLLYVWLAEPEIAFTIDSVIRPGIGFWLTIIGLLAIAIGGYLVYRQAALGGGAYGQPTYEGYTQTSMSGAGVNYGGATLDSGDAGVYQPPAQSFTGPVTLNDPPPAPPRHATEVLDRRDPLVMAWLVMKDGPRAGHTFRLLETTSIGRDAGNDVIIDDASLSGQHAKIKFEDGDHYVIYDLASTNGLFYFDEEKQEWVRDYRISLQDGQQVKLGRTVLHFMAPNVNKSA